MLRKSFRHVLFLMLISVQALGAGLDDVREDQLDGNLKSAESSLRSLVSSDRANAGLYLYLLGSNLALQNKCGDAVAVFDRVISEHAESAWRDKSEFGKADCLISLGKFEAAEKIYSRKTEHLLGSDRKMEIASIYIKYADLYFAPEDKNTAPNYDRASIFYVKALSLEMPIQEELKVRMRLALCYHNTGNYSYAFSELYYILAVEDIPEEIERKAMYYIGMGRLNQGLQSQARQKFEDFLEKYPDDENAPEAAYLLGKTHGLPNPGSMMKLELGVKAHKEFVEKFSTHEKAPLAAYEIALSYYNTGRYEEAIEQLEIVIGMFGKRPDVDEAPQAKILLGQCYYDQGKFTEAIARWKKFTEEHPTHHRWREVSSKIIDAEFAIAAHAEKKEDYDAARSAFNRFLEDHPLDDRARDAMFELGNIEYRLEAWNEAIRLWKKLVSKYPDSEQASRAQFEIAQIYEYKFDDQESAIEEYEQVRGSYSGQARSRISVMNNPELSIFSERSFNTSEKPVLKLSTRNIESLKGKAYKIDIETYFRKYHDFRGIENLDIALIDPDITWDFNVEDYRKLKTYELDMDVPLPGAGIYAVTVGNDDLEATTVMLVTDIAAVIKTAPGATLVFAQDTRTGRPVPGVDVLISNGRGVFKAGNTGSNGVLLYEEQVSGGTVAVLAMKGGSIASNRLGGGSGSTARQGDHTKGIMYTDRTAYRPGQKVNIKGIVRDSVNGNYSFSTGTEYSIRITSPGGAILHTEKVRLSEFGTFNLSYDISASAEPGNYSVTAYHRNSNMFSSFFKVEEYKLQRIKLSVEPERDIYRRGEEIKAKVKAAYYFGQPAAGKQIGYRVSYGPQILNDEGTTDDKGELDISFKGIEDFDENTRIMIYTYMKDEDVSASADVWISVTEFALNVSTLREVYLAGESVGVEVHAADVTGDPVSTDVTLEVMKLVTEHGSTSEVRVRKLEMEPGDTGVNRATVNLSEGGHYILRAFARDRFNNPITAEKRVFISGDEDTNRLRIITERDEYRVGESPSVKIVYREEPALALITFEGKTILGYRLVELAKGENNIKIDIEDDFAPNFTFSVAVMEDNRFHFADKDFNALKGLVISLVPDSESYEPGGQMKLKVKTTDSNGVPVRAELSLALVDEALYSLYADNVPNLGVFFFGGKRPSNFQTISTNTFSYQGKTSAVLQELVAERDRMEKAAAQKETKKSRKADSYSMVAPSMIVADYDMAEEMEAPDDMVRYYGYAGGAPAQPTTRRKMGRLAEVPESEPDMLMQAPARLREFFPETGYWNPAVDTGAKGETELAITMPDTATTWRLTSRGVTVNTLVGEKTASVVTKKNFFITMKNPRVIVQGSKSGFLVELHNLTDEEVSATVETSLAAGAPPATESRKLAVPANGTVTELFHFETREYKAKTAVFSVTATAGKYSDRLKIDIPTLPMGVQISTAKSGSASENASADVAFPSNMTVENHEMFVLLSPSALASVMDVNFPGYYTNNTAALEMVSILYRMEYLKDTGADASAYAALSSRFNSLSMQLISNIEGNGTLKWSTRSSRHGNPSTSVTASAVWAMSLARDMGLDFDRTALDRAANALKDHFSHTENNELKAEILHALSYMDGADFAYLNRLDRERAALSTRALAFVTLCYANLGRTELADNAAAELERRLSTADIPVLLKDESERFGIPTHDPVADTALALLALVRARQSSPAVAKLLQTVESARRGDSWGCPDTTAFSVAALSTYYAKTAHASDRYTLEILVNGKHVKNVEVNSSQPAIRIPVPAELIDTGAGRRNTVNFKMDGRGKYSYSVVLTGTTSPSSYKSFAGYDKVYFHSDSGYYMSPPRFMGDEYGPGSSVLSKYKSYPGNETSEVPVGDYVTEKFNIYDTVEAPFSDFLVVEQPLPAGTYLDKESISGSYEHYQLRDDKIVFFCAGVCGASYKITGYLPGEYAMLPATVYPAAEPWLRYHTAGGHSFKVLAPGEMPSKEYVLSPDQLYNLGAAYFNYEMYDEAEPLLSRLISEYELRDDPFKETHRMLMEICIVNDDSRCIVEHFEVLKEKYPTLSLDFSDILRVGRAYRDIEEYERAIQVYATALEASFMTDGEARIFLEDQGRFLDSLEFLTGLARQYPDMNVVKNAVYSNAHVLYSKMDKTDSMPELKEEEIGREEILGMAVTAFRDYMLLYPQSPYIDEASFSLASVLFDLEENAEVISAARTFQRRYTESPFLDSFEYLEAYGHFESGNYSAALRLCEKIATGEYRDASGRLEKSDSRDLALYITAQIYHAMNNPGKAFEYYEKVRGKFQDAAGAYEYFNRTTFSVPEITSVRSGRKASVKITHRNVKEVEVKVYRVDLVKFYLTRKSLKGMSEIRLSGVKPIYEKMITLAKEQEYRDRETDVDIPLNRDGAYLVEMRAGGMYASGMLLCTNLELEVQEDSASGRVRVNVLDTRSGRYVNKAHVKIVGSRDGRVRSGDTDLRGIYTADGVSGSTAVLVRKDDQFAFYSGSAELMAGPASPRPAVQQQIDSKAMRLQNTGNIGAANDMIQMRNADFLRQNMAVQEGIQIQQIENNPGQFRIDAQIRQKVEPYPGAGQYDVQQVDPVINR